MVIWDFLWTRGLLFGTLLIFLKVQNGSTQMPSLPAAPANGLQEPQSLMQLLPYSLHSFLQSQTIGEGQTSQSATASNTQEPNLKIPLSMFSEKSASFPTPEQLSFNHYGPGHASAKPKQPNLVDLLMQQVQSGESSNMLQLFLMMNALRPTETKAAEVTTITKVAKKAKQSESAKTIKSAADVQSVKLAGPSTKNVQKGAQPTIKSSEASKLNVIETLKKAMEKSNTLPTNDGNISVTFTGLSKKLGLGMSQTNGSKTMNLKRTILERLLANRLLKLKRIKFLQDGFPGKTQTLSTINIKTAAKTPLENSALDKPKMNTPQLQSSEKSSKPKRLDTSGGQVTMTVTQSPLSQQVTQNKQQNHKMETTRDPQVPQVEPTKKRQRGNAQVPARPKLPKVKLPNKSPTQKDPMQPLTAISPSPPTFGEAMPPLLNTAGQLTSTRQKENSTQISNWRYPNYPYDATQQNHISYHYKNPVPYQNVQYANQPHQGIYPGRHQNHQINGPRYYSEQPVPRHQSNRIPYQHGPQPYFGHPDQRQYQGYQQFQYQGVQYPNEYAYGHPAAPYSQNPYTTIPYDPMLSISTDPTGPPAEVGEAQAEYLEQNPPTEIPPVQPTTTPVPPTTTASPNFQTNSGNQWLEFFSFLNRHFPGLKIPNGMAPPSPGRSGLRSAGTSRVVIAPNGEVLSGPGLQRPIFPRPQHAQYPGFHGGFNAGRMGMRQPVSTTPATPTEAVEIEPAEAEPTPAPKPGPTTTLPPYFAGSPSNHMFNTFGHQQMFNQQHQKAHLDMFHGTQPMFGNQVAPNRINQGQMFDHQRTQNHRPMFVNNGAHSDMTSHGSVFDAMKPRFGPSNAHNINGGFPAF